MKESRLFNWYWRIYYSYGRLYRLWQYLFPVTGRKENMYFGDERMFRPIYKAWRLWHRIALTRSTYKIYLHRHTKQQALAAAFNVLLHWGKRA